MRGASNITNKLVSLGLRGEQAVAVEAALDDLESQPEELQRVLVQLDTPDDRSNLEEMLVDLQLHLQHTQSHVTEALTVVGDALGKLALERVKA